MQCDCIVTQLYRDVFRLEYCSVLGPPFHRVVIRMFKRIMFGIEVRFVQPRCWNIIACDYQN
jgi:hypothetical protein